MGIKPATTRPRQIPVKPAHDIAPKPATNSICWGGDGFVKMADNTLTKQIRNMKVGDLISTCNEKVDVVDYITKTVGNITAVKVLHKNLIMTPQHPIRINDKFVLPIDVPHEKVVVDVVYNFILRNRSHLCVNGVEAPTLGDGDRNDPILRHAYWGTRRIIDDIETISKFIQSNVISFDAMKNEVLKDANGNDVGIKHEALLV